jgi:hyperosmotically inducible periplasmic protein
MKRKLSLVLVGILLSIPVWAQAGETGGGRYDLAIQQEAIKLLQSKDEWKNVTASTDDGIVLLQGQTKLLIDKLDAAKKIYRLNHVNGVRNHIQVEGNVPDQQLHKEIADQLRYDRVGFGIVFNALGIGVQNGVVTVDGDVHDYPSRDSALDIIETTPGVKDVIDNIKVLPPSPMDDRIRLRVARAVYGNAALSKYAINPEKPIRIVVDNGHVTLYGAVDSKMDKELAGMQARSVPGIFSVQNKLIVAGSNSGKSGK